MKKSFKVVSLFSAFAVAGLTLASCMISINPGQTTTTTAAPAQTTTTAVVTDTEVATTPVEGGKYNHNNIVYEFDKTNKKIKATKYETYAQYLANTGTAVFTDKDVKYVEYTSATGGAIKFSHENVDYYIYKNSLNKLRFDVKRSSSSTSSGGCFSLNDLATPAYGTFVSTKQTQDKVDAQGQRIPTGEGGYQKEDFYLFVVLTETSAKVYVSDNNTTHGSTPLYQKDNYNIELINGHLIIKIPHNTEKNYDCSIVFNTATTIDVTNSSETHGDYSMSGILTLVEE